MVQYTHRERLLAAVDHVEPDRVPRGAYTMTDVCYRNLRAYLGLPERPLEYSGTVSDVVRPHEDLLRRFDLDSRDVQLPDETARQPTSESDLYYENDIGVGFRKYGVYYYFPVHHPLSGQRSARDVESHPWPDPQAGSIADVVAEARRLRRETDCALVMGVGGTFFAYAWFLCGDDWFVDLATEPAFCDALLDKLLELDLARAERLFDALGPDAIDVAICTTDDMGMQTGLLVSPETYRRFVKPRHKAFFDYVRSRSNARLFMHCDGEVYDLLPDFCDIGVDILNPVQVECKDMGDTARLKREFGRDLAFWGAIDIQHTLTFGTPAEVRDEVRRRIDDLAAGGGFILTPRWALRPEVPPENICAVYEAADEYGQY